MNIFRDSDPNECTLYHGKDDHILDKNHLDDIINLNPSITVNMIECGHMINLEIPDFFDEISLSKTE